MRRTALLLALLVASPLLAQEPVLEEGLRVRVTAPALSEGPLVGTYGGIRDDGSLLLGENRWAIPSSALEKVEVYAGTGANFWKGAAIGAISGGLLGAFIGLTWPGPSDFGHVAAGFLVGVPVGGLVGGGVGAVVHTEKWEPVELPAKPMVAVHPTGRFSGGVSIPRRR
jgi:hypothetical protein